MVLQVLSARLRQRAGAGRDAHAHGARWAGAQQRAGIQNSEPGVLLQVVTMLTHPNPTQQAALYAAQQR